MSSPEIDRMVLSELRDHLDRAAEWADPGDVDESPEGWSCITSTIDAVVAGNVGLALTRWDDLSTRSKPRLSELAENWRAWRKLDNQAEEPRDGYKDEDLSGCFNANANMLEAYKIKIASQLAQGNGIIDVPAYILLYLIDRAQRWERMSHDLKVHNHRRLP